MPVEEPGWWYAPPGDPRAGLLRPLSRAYALVSERRMAKPPRYTAAVPVICIGNFTAGGTGKTPLSLKVAGIIRARGLAPGFLTRGYGARRKGPVWVEPTIDTAEDVGDEPLLLARLGPVMISPDRERGARMMEARSPTLDAIIMDDGLQNPVLAKTLRIAVVDGRRGFGNGEVIPAGPLRAPLPVQLAHADAIVINHPPDTGMTAARAPLDWLRDRFPGPVMQAEPRPAGDVSWLAGRPVLAFAGIANPQRFYGLLAALGAQVVEIRSFRDHHAFSDAEVRALLDRARRLGAQLVTTEKDHVRLVGHPGARAELAAQSKALAIALHMSERDEVRLAGLIDGCWGKR